MNTVHAPTHSARPLEHFLRVYAGLNADNLELLDTVYHRDVIFTDPMRHINGLSEMRNHFASLYRNLISCRFDFDTLIDDGAAAAVDWRMHYRHRAVGRGRPVTVPGCSMLRFDADSGRVIMHRDYFDMGAMLYEHLPLVGPAIRAIRQRAGA